MASLYENAGIYDLLENEHKYRQSNSTGRLVLRNCPESINTVISTFCLSAINSTPIFLFKFSQNVIEWKTEETPEQTIKQNAAAARSCGAV